VSLNMVIVLLLLLQLVGLVFSVSVDAYISRRHKRIFYLIALAIFALMIQNRVEFALSHTEPHVLIRTISVIIGYSLRPVILLLYFYIVDEQSTHLLARVLVGVNAFVYLTALVSPLSFYISDVNVFHRGPLGFTSHIISAFLLAALVVQTIRRYGKLGKMELFIPQFNAGLIVASVYMDTFHQNAQCPISYLTMAVITCSLFYYIWLHLQFVREHERDLQAEQRIRIMMTQIQPHFLFNTITAFTSLCRIDPIKAEDVATKFAGYLRRNLYSLNVEGCVPFRQELEHTQLYADIEMVRFDNVRVEYDIGDDDFELPPLTVQPMVENAISHGVRIRDKGIVRVVTYRAEDGHKIVVEDNGVGFEAQKLDSLSEEHVGLRNVRERIESMCGGTLVVESTADVGTKVTITIPLQGKRGQA